MHRIRELFAPLSHLQQQLGSLAADVLPTTSRRAKHRPALSPGQACGIVACLLLVAVLFVYARSQRMNSGKELVKAMKEHAAAAAAHGSAAQISEAELERIRKAAAVLDPEMMHDPPQQYNSTFLNPCWQSEAAGKLRCLPYYYVSGFHTGAGALARQLRAHPNVLMDAGILSSWGPSWGFWSEYRNTLKGYMDGIEQVVPRLLEDLSHNVVMDGAMSTFALYWAASGKAHRAFSTAAVSCWQECDKQFTSAGPKYEACMEGKCFPAGRAADQQAAVNASLPYTDLQLPFLMKALYGHRTPKFVFMFRNPVDRIYSAFYGLGAMVSKYGNHSEGFTAFVADQLEAYRLCVEHHGEEACIMRFETLGMQEEKVFFHCDQLFRGMYARYLEVWLRYFPRSSFLILQSEECFKDWRGCMKQTLDFLGLPVPEPDSPTWAAMEQSGPAVSNVESRDFIPEGARRFLSKLYDQHNKDLATLLGDNKWLKWNVDSWSRSAAAAAA